MKFKDLYIEEKQAFRKRAEALWCSSNETNDSSAAYIRQIKSKIDEMFAPDNAMPLVQCMNSYEQYQGSIETANELVENLWQKPYQPYQHQYNSWKSLRERTTDGRVKSIVVTTGTGSGKTECFMLPLVADLKRENRVDRNSCVQAIFLYPLNALMEDQKTRLQSLLEGTKLKFAVYNSNLPEREDANDNELNARIQYEKSHFPNIVETREKMRSEKPNIILTNPTMLEYMLLRDKDQSLFTRGTLRWVVLDETHTYTGAGAAELSMLMRRVLNAYNVTSDQVRFSTSSATIGNANDPNQEAENDLKLKKFISDISGQQEDQIDIIKGKRTMVGNSLSGEAETCRQKLFEEEYCPLDKLINGQSIEDRLEKLDQFCEQGLKAKVHFFHRVMNQGLRVRLSDVQDGSFKIHTTIPLDRSGQNSEPYLELVRCSNCGEFLAMGEYNENEPDVYHEVSVSDNDIFDFDSDEEQGKKLFFSLSKDRPDPSNGSTVIEIDGGHMKNRLYTPGQWNLIRNVQCCCPHCSASLNRKGKNADDEIEELSEQKLKYFRLSAERVSRIISPVLLSSVAPSNMPGKLHQGQQYLSFVDSRQSAARSTLNQNIEEEKLWVISRIFKELNERKIHGGKNYISWKEIKNLLFRLPECSPLCLQFVNRSKGTQDLDTNGQVTDTAIEQYLYAVMIELLGRRPAKAFSPETAGLFTSFYPSLDKITELPDEVKKFNQSLSNNNPISISDWKNLLHVFLDYSVRSNMSVYLTDDEHPRWNIKDNYQRYKTQKAATRPIHFPKIDKSGNYHLIVRLLAALIEDTDVKIVVQNHEEVIKNVLKALERDLIETTGILTIEDSNRNDPDPYRLNLMELNFKLFDRIYLCDTSRYANREKILRPVEVLFKGFSPYVKNGSIKSPAFEESFDSFYDYSSQIDFRRWAEKHRSILWTHGIWGKDGVFTPELDEIYSFPDIFVQAEHTAQIDKLVAKESQRMFKDKDLNILACSTTMEMGVDLGDLELVLLSSVPPHPANYKQRAGRSGRDLNINRSACVTLCGSDSLGLRTLYNPMENIIDRPTAIPFVDLNSRQVVQRHVNSYLLRESQCFFRNQHANNLDQMIINFFTPFSFGIDLITGSINYGEVRDANGELISPDKELGDASQTKYFEFINAINNKQNLLSGLKKLIAGTCFEGRELLVVQNSVKEIQRTYDEIKQKIEDSAYVYNESRQNINARKGSFTSENQFRQYLATYRQNNNAGLGKDVWRCRKILNQYHEILSTNLLMYLATHRFTPNANMPVEIIEFDINFNSVRRVYNNDRPSNPSYTLQDALSQYAPGNTVVISNKARVVRGIRWTGGFRDLSTFKNVYSDGENVAIAQQNPYTNAQKWDVNGKDYIELVQPYAFLPDISESESRTITPNVYTRVDAQLIGTTSWTMSNNDSRMIAVRTNDDSGDASILYYNVGIGYGYCICKRCGRAVMEYGPASYNKVKDTTPQNFNNGIEKSTVKGVAVEIPYHSNIAFDSKFKCSSHNDQQNFNLLKRNVIIGSTIQTDYCELKLRASSTATDWFTKKDNKKVLLTLAIAFRRCLVEHLGIESRDVDFFLMPSGHICLFDNNPGGSGYSKRLGDTAELDFVLRQSRTLLESIDSKEKLLDRYTYRYRDNIDIAGALTWLSNEYASRNNVPSSVQKSFPGLDVVKSSITSLKNALLSVPASDSALFVSARWNKWCYNNGQDDEDWNRKIYSVKSLKSSIYVLGVDTANIPLPIVRVMNQMKDWSSDIKMISNPLSSFFPLAYVPGKLFFTTFEDYADANSSWATDGDLYSVNMTLDLKVAESIDVDALLNRQNVLKFTLKKGDYPDAITKDIPRFVYEKSERLVQEFLAYARTLPSSEEVIVTYQDEHLKNELAIIAALQFITYFLEKIGRKNHLTFQLEEYFYTGNITNFKINTELSQILRDSLLSDKIDLWKNYVYDESYDNLDNQNSDMIVVSPKKTLPHWRVLRFECGKKALNFYPNGGIINEWFYDYK